MLAADRKKSGIYETHTTASIYYRMIDRLKKELGGEK